MSALPRSLPVAVLFAAAAIGCASSESPTPPAPVVAPSPTASPAPEAPAAPASLATVASIKASGKLRVAADPDAAPFLSKAADGTWEGFEYPLMRAVADRFGAQVEIVPASFADLVPTVTSGKADVAIGQLSPSDAWTGVGWSVSYLQYSLCLIAPTKSPITGMADLKGKKVAMYDDPVTRQLTDLLVSATYERVVFEDYGYFEKMVRGQIDAMVYDCPLARHEMTTYGDALHIVDDKLNIATYNVAVPTGDPQLLTEVNGVLKELGNSGLLATLEQRWFGASAATEDFSSATGKVVVVKKGESLSMIAKRELGDTEKWKAIYDTNKDVVGPDPNEIYTGMKLRMPR